MSTHSSVHATGTRTRLCPHCHGTTEVTLEHPSGTFDPCLEQWFPDFSTYQEYRHLQEQRDRRLPMLLKLRRPGQHG